MDQDLGCIPVAETPSGGFTVTNQRSNVSEYNSDGQLLIETDAQGRSQTYSYDTVNRLATVTNHYGLSLSFVYSTDGKDYIISVTDSTGVQYQYEYDATTISLQ